MSIADSHSSTPRPGTPSLQQQVARGVTWNAGNALGGFAIQILRGIVLARLLLPQDFGVVGVAIGVVNICQMLVGLGLGPAIIQAREISRATASAAFTIQTAAAALFAAGLAVASPFIAEFYDKPVLQGVLWILCIGMVLDAMMNVPLSLMARDLRFKETNVMWGGLRFVSFVGAIIMAAAGCGMWSLIVPDVVVRAAAMPILCSRLGWRPRLSFDHRALSDLSSCSRKSYLNTVIATLNSNVDYVLLGMFFPAREFGYYFFSFQRVRGPLRSGVTTIRGALFPALSRKQDSHAALERTLNQMVAILAACVFPSITILILSMKPVVTLAFGESWLPCVTMMQLFCVWAYLIPINLFVTAALTARNQHGLMAWEGGVRCLAVAVAVVALGYANASIVACAALLVALELMGNFVIMFVGCNRLGLPLRDVLRVHRPAALGALAVLFADVGICSLVSPATTWIQILVLLSVRWLTAALVALSVIRATGPSLFGIGMSLLKLLRPSPTV